ncbi:MAG: maleylpyruvate isomerase N-terminal domain-containing protein, partial [Acidimicrobiales bacterium]
MELPLPARIWPEGCDGASMTNTETPTELDPRAVFGRAFATARTVLDGIGPDQFDLPTPCTEYDVRTLAGHLLAVA